MKCSNWQRGIFHLGLALGLLSGLADAAGPEKYWEWGWGSYGAGSVLDDARFDWWLIGFGNIPADQRTVDRCNEMLKLNPRIKFVIRVWPIMGLGDCVENRHQATFLHYLYKPGVREEVLKRTRDQIQLIAKGIAKPENLVGSVFLEELPGHFSASPFGPKWSHWRQGDELPWDVKRFKTEIEKELGEPFNPTSIKHRQWWGQKWCQVIEEINRTMKEANGGKTVIYYQATSRPTLDHNPTGKPDYNALADVNVVPISYRDIVKPGVCDGIFGYPNNAKIWEWQTQAMVKQFNCRMFSQISLPPGMRLCRLEEMAALARWETPGNLGAFFYGYEGRKGHEWNAIEYQDDRYWTIMEHARRFCWDRKIGMDVVQRALLPEMAMAYDFRNSKKGGFVHLWVTLFNPRDASWFGGQADLAQLHDVKVSLKLPAGFSLPVENNAGETLKLGDLQGREGRSADWWVRVDREMAELTAADTITAVLTAAGGIKAQCTGTGPQQTIPVPEERILYRAGDNWLEPAVGNECPEPTVELEPLTGEILCPELLSGGQRLLYRDTLVHGTKLIVGPGYQARLVTLPLFTEESRRFAPAQPGPDGVVAFADGYLVHRTPAVPVVSGKKYRLSVTGWGKDGGNVMVLIRFSGRRGKKDASEDLSCFAGQFREQKKTLQREVTVPAFKSNQARASLMFYRYKQTGTVYFESFDFTPVKGSVEGDDVTARLEGVPPPLDAPFTVWTYRDQSNPVRYGKPKLKLRFLRPAEAVED